MEINAKGLQIIKACEGLRLVAYKCSAGVWTIGYGHTGADVYEGLQITPSQAEKLLLDDLHWTYKIISRYVRLELNSNQFSSLCSFIFNVGSGNFKASTLRQKLNRGDLIGASNEFWKWRRANGVILQGLVKRREVEKLLFLSPMPQTQYHHASESPQRSMLGALKAYCFRT